MGAREQTADLSAETIVAKTRTGEVALGDREHPPPPHLRTMLVVVDGRSTVAELSARLGGLPVDEALAELFARGWIAPLDNHATDLNAGRLFPDKAKAGSQHHPGARPRAQRSKSGLRLEERPEGAKRGLQRTSEADGRSSAARQKPHGRRNRMQRERAGMERPARRRPLRSGLVVLASLLAAALATVWLYPNSRHVAEFEAALKDALGIPVEASGLTFRLWPVPGIALTDVQLGTQQAARARAIVFRLQPAASAGGLVRKDIIGVEGLEIGPETANRLLPVVMGQRATRLPDLRRVDLTEMRMTVAGETSAAWNGRIRLAGSDPGDVSLEAADGKAHARLKPLPGGYSVQFDAQALSAQAMTPLPVERLEGVGTLRPNELRLDRVEGEVAGSAFTGRFLLEWDRSVMASGTVQFARVPVAELLSSGRYARVLQGEGAVGWQFQATGPRLAGVWSNMSGSGRVEMDRGALLGLDIVGAVRSASTAAGRGGQTRFESFSARFEHGPSGARLREVALNSGLMQAQGEISVDPSRRLEGQFLVELRSTANPVRALAAVGGTLSDPRISAR